MSLPGYSNRYKLTARRPEVVAKDLMSLLKPALTFPTNELKADKQKEADILTKKKMEDFKKANPIPQQGIQILINQGDKNDKNLREDVLETAEKIYTNVKREDLIRMIMDALRTKKSRPDALQ